MAETPECGICWLGHDAPCVLEPNHRGEHYTKIKWFNEQSGNWSRVEIMWKAGEEIEVKP
jgi:hypothetical protein